MATKSVSSTPPARSASSSSSSSAPKSPSSTSSSSASSRAAGSTSKSSGSTASSSGSRATTTSPSTHEARTRSLSDARRSETSSTSSTATREKDEVLLSEEARDPKAAAEAEGKSPVDFATWGLDGKAQNGNVSELSKPGAGGEPRALKDSPAADAKAAEQLANKPLQLDKGELLSRGSEGDKVQQLQAMLNKYGGKKLTEDGDMGRRTSRALRQFQREHKLRPDGIAGPKTQAKLNQIQAEHKKAEEAAAARAAETAGVKGQQGTQSGEAPKKTEEVKGPTGATPAPEKMTSPPAKLGAEQPTPPARTEQPTPPAKTEQAGAIPPARPEGGTPVDLGKLHTLQSAQKNPDGSYSFRAGASIDVDGSGPKYGDPYAQNGTSLEVKGENGRKQALNADKTPYFVLPPAVAKKMGARPGDLGIISYNGKSIPAVFGDQGPGHRIGELSRKAALDLGIPASPISGGVPKGVDYRVFPGSRPQGMTRASDVTPERLQERVQQLLKQDTETRAGEQGAATQGVPPAGQTPQVDPAKKVGETAPVGQTPPVDQGGKKMGPESWPVPRPNGLREIMKTFGPAGSSNLKRVMAAAGPGGKTIPVSMHSKIADQFVKAFDEVKRQGLGSEIASFDGSYNNRNKRGGGSKSTHAWAIAFDLNAGRYPMGTTPAQTSAKFQKIAEILEAHGFKQLSKDAHHFQYATGY